LPGNAGDTQRLPGNAGDTQRLPPGSERTQQFVSDGERTQQIKPLDPKFNPEATQQLEPVPTSTQRLPDPAAAADAQKAAETTQRIDDSIWRLQEAKRILQNIPQKN
jgi:hypothetical protein